MNRIKNIKDTQGKVLELTPAAPTEIERGGIIATTVDDTTNMEEVVVGKDGRGYVSNENVVENSKKIQQNTKDIEQISNIMDQTLRDGYYYVDRYKESGTYPTKEGKVFAGWYTDETLEEPYLDSTGIAYAYFIDEKVLDVRMYLFDDNPNSPDKPYYIKFISTLDKKWENIKSAGFKLSGKYGDKTLNNREVSVTKVYTGISNIDISLGDFSEESAVFIAYNLAGLDLSNLPIEFSACVFFVTADGTKVYGPTCETYAIEGDTLIPKEETYATKTEINQITEDVKNLSNTLADGIICSVNGESIHIKDASDKQIVAQTIYGKSKQITTTGAQLLNVNTDEYFFKATYVTFEFAVNKGSIFTFPNGSDNLKSGNTRFLVYKLSVEEGKTYTISGSSKGTSVLATLSRYPKNTQDLSEREAMLFNPINGSYTFTAEDKDYMIEFRTPSTPEGGVSTDSTIITLMLNEGETALPYEPYTGGQPSPSLNYPQEIESSGNSGYIEEVIMGEQLLDIHGCTILEKNMKNSVIDINGDSLVTISFVADTATEGGHARPHLIIDITDITNMDETYVVSLDSLQANYVTQAEIRKENNKRILYILWGKSSAQGGYPVTGTKITAKFRIMLNKGDVAFSWEPYKSQQIYLSTPNGLHGIPVGSGGNYTDENGQQWVCDTIEKYADGTGKRIQRTISFNLSDLSWMQAGVDGRFHSTSSSLPKLVRERMICQCVRRSGWAVSDLSADVQEGYVVFRNNEFTMSQGTDFNNWIKTLAGKDKTICQLAEPIETPLTVEELAELENLHTFKPITNITTDSDAGIEIDYVADTKTYIDNKFKELATAIIAGGES